MLTFSVKLAPPWNYIMVWDTCTCKAEGNIFMDVTPKMTEIPNELPSKLPTGLSICLRCNTKHEIVLTEIFPAKKWWFLSIPLDHPSLHAYLEPFFAVQGCAVQCGWLTHYLHTSVFHRKKKIRDPCFVYKTHVHASGNHKARTGYQMSSAIFRLHMYIPGQG